MKLLKVDTLEEAREKIWDCYKKIKLKSHIKNIDEPGEAILAENIYAGENVPAFRRSVVDGYAVYAADTAGAQDAIPVFLKLAGTVEMGKEPDFKIKSGYCAYVPTGGMLPEGANAVVMLEYSESTGGLSKGTDIAIYEPASVGTGMVDIGDDIKKDELFLKKGTLIGPKEKAALSALGINSFPVFTPLNLSIISTGDELVPPNVNPSYGEIRDINTSALKALAIKRAFNVISCEVLPDNEEKIETAIKKALPLSDIIVISGGSSQGDKDYTALLIDRVSRPGVFTHGLALKPGKPSIFGWDEESSTLLAGLPGHPVAAMMVFELILGNLCDKLFSRDSPFVIPATIATNVPGDPGRTVCQPVKLHLINGAYEAEPVFGKSGLISTLKKADGYILIDLNREGLKKTEAVLVNLF